MSKRCRKVPIIIIIIIIIIIVIIIIIIIIIICLRLKLVFVAVSIVHSMSRFYSYFLFLKKTSLINRTQIQQLNWSPLHRHVLTSWTLLSAIL